MNTREKPLLIVGRDAAGQKFELRRIPNAKPIKVTRKMLEDYAAAVARDILKDAHRYPA